MVRRPLRHVFVAVIACTAAALDQAPPGPVSGQALQEVQEVGHVCIHGRADMVADRQAATARHEAAREELQHRRRAGVPVTAGGVPYARVFEVQAGGRQSMRIVVATEDLDDATKYCLNGAHASVGDFKGGTVPCATGGEDDFTLAKRDMLLNTIMPQAIAEISRMLAVDRVVGNLPVTAGSCSHFRTPAAMVGAGVPDADFLLLLSAAPTTGTTVAWAAACEFDGSSGRPIVGKANFGPKHLTHDPVTGNPTSKRVLTAVHEMMHALGFTADNFGAGKKIVTEQVTRRGRQVTVLKGTASVREARKFHACTTLEGVELEQEGGAGTAGSHFERRLMRDDTMAGISAIGTTGVTLGIFEDLGWYEPNYTVVAHPRASWGRDAGCSFVTDKCDTTAGGKDKWFCFDTGSPQSCTHDFMAVGYCKTYTYTSALPAAMQFFSDPKMGGAPLMDGCPMVEGYSNRQCWDATFSPSSAEVAFGNVFGSSSRCFEVKNNFGATSAAGEAHGFRCLESRCVGQQVQVKSGAKWVACSDGVVLQGGSQLPGHLGQLVCPKGADFCPSATNVTGQEEPLPTPPPNGSPGNAVDGSPGSESTAGGTPAPSSGLNLNFAEKLWNDCTGFCRYGVIGGAALLIILCAVICIWRCCCRREPRSTYKK